MLLWAACLMAGRFVAMTTSCSLVLMLLSYTSVGMQRLLSARLKAGVRAPTWAVALHVLGREAGLAIPGLDRPRSGLAEPAGASGDDSIVFVSYLHP